MLFSVLILISWYWNNNLYSSPEPWVLESFKAGLVKVRLHWAGNKSLVLKAIRNRTGQFDDNPEVRHIPPLGSAGQLGDQQQFQAWW